MVVGEQVGLKLARVACALRLIVPVLIEEGSALTCMRILGAHDVVKCAIDRNAAACCDQLWTMTEVDPETLCASAPSKSWFATCNIVHQHIQGVSSV